MAPLSTHELAPISTLSSRITFPICSIFTLSPFLSFIKPKPSAPITAPGCNITFSPNTQNSLITALEYIIEFFPIFTPSIIVTLG